MQVGFHERFSTAYSLLLYYIFVITFIIRENGSHALILYFVIIYVKSWMCVLVVLPIGIR